jgi:YD repeat-containing protein
MVKSVVNNSGAGYVHPDDPSLRIQMVAVVNPVGLPDLGSGTHAYGYDGSGNLTTDTWTVNANVYLKTFSYTAGNLTGETDWVKQ